MKLDENLNPILPSLNGEISDINNDLLYDLSVEYDGGALKTNNPDIQQAVVWLIRGVICAGLAYSGAKIWILIDEHRKR